MHQTRTVRLAMILLRYLLKTVILGWVIKLLGRFFPVLLRLLRLWR
jgi:hypothetical protein